VLDPGFDLSSKKKKKENMEGIQACPEADKDSAETLLQAGITALTRQVTPGHNICT
jgi:hypothetical protein